MIMLRRFGLLMFVGMVVVAGAEIGERLAIPGIHSVIPAAEAEVGRPLTPVSVAGVARRHDRRN